MSKRFIKKNSPGGTRISPLLTPPPLLSCGKITEQVWGLLCKGFSVTQMATNLRRDRATIRYHLHKLENAGYAKYENHLWHNIYKGEGGGKILVGYERGGGRTTPEWVHDRAHNIKVKYEIINSPKNKDWLNNWIPNNELKNHIQWRKRFGDILQIYTGKSIIFQLPVMQFKNSEIAMAEAARIADRLASRIMHEVPGLELGDRNVHTQAHTISQHHAIPNDPYAKWLKKHGITFKDDIIDVDASESPELEFTDSEKAHIHHEDYANYIKDIVLNDHLKPSELLDAINKTHMIVREIASAQVNTQVQLQSLIEIIKPPRKIENISEGTFSYIQ